MGIQSHWTQTTSTGSILMTERQRDPEVLADHCARHPFPGSLMTYFGHYPKYTTTSWGSKYKKPTHQPRALLTRYHGGCFLTEGEISELAGVTGLH